MIQFSLLGLAIALGWIIWQQDIDLSQLLKLTKNKPQPEIRLVPSKPTTRGPDSYSEAVNSSAPSVVTIYTSKTTQQAVHPLLDDPVLDRLLGDQLKRYKRDKTETNLGSGVIVSADGYILTNNHVIDGADEILVSLPDGRSSSAQLIGQDRDTDIAVLRIPFKDLPPIKIAEQESPLQVGDIVLAIGNPLNVGQTVTMGIISATGRNRVGLNIFENFIQTDAAINPGNSGGALINAQGHLIGINTAIFSQSGGSQGIGFAIPISLALSVMNEIAVHGKVSRGWLGVEGTEITAKAAMESGNPNIRGVLVVGVFVNSPADVAGVQNGDIITAIDHNPVYQVRNVLEMIAAHKPGDSVILSLFRDGQPLEITVATTQRPQ